jgi:hypothetical protein
MNNQQDVENINEEVWRMTRARERERVKIRPRQIEQSRMLKKTNNKHGVFF